ITYSLGGNDASSFNLGASSGEMTFITSPDFETQSSYSVTITATDNSNNSTDLLLTITVNDLDEGAPVFTSATDISVDENIPTSEIIYTATATDAGTITYSLGGSDANSFNLGASSGEMTFITSPDFETQSSYSVVITATDDSNNATDLMLTISVNDLDEGVPLSVFESLKLSIYPNPVADQLIIEGYSLKNFQQLLVTSLEGKVILDFNDLNAKSFDLSGLSSGIYLLMLKSDEQLTSAGRIIKK
ncbi:MAG: cadherin domain-containing protein, partial [Bacteroidota bacterium]